MGRETISQTSVEKWRDPQDALVSHRACWAAVLSMLAHGACALEHEPSESESATERANSIDASRASSNDTPPRASPTTMSPVASAEPAAPDPSANNARNDAESTSFADAATVPPAPETVSSGSQGMAATAPHTCSQLTPPAATCPLAANTHLAEDLTVDLLGTTRYYAQGALLPAGRYRVAYVDGCVNSMLTIAMAGPLGAGSWTVHPTAIDVAGIGTTAPDNACWLVGEGKVPVKIAPGTAGVSAGVRPRPIGAFDTYAECVAANCRQPPEEFFFGGGKLGVRIGSALSVPVTSGEAVGGRAPTFRISRVDPCP